MKQLKNYSITGTIFVIILGTLSHFLYGWSGRNVTVGLFTPVDESVWEHMKLLFFPMLLFSAPMAFLLRKRYPCVIPSLCAGILAGTFCIPLLFFTYTYVLGKNFLVLDIAVFFLSVATAFFAAYRLTKSCRLQPYALCFYSLVFVLLLCFLLFSYAKPYIPLCIPTAVPYG